MASTNIVTNEVFQEEMKKLRAALGGGDSSSNNGGVDNSSGSGSDSSGAFIIDVDTQLLNDGGHTDTLNKTWAEIYNAFMSGRNCIVRYIDGAAHWNYQIAYIANQESAVNGYTLSYIDFEPAAIVIVGFAANGEDDYPIYTFIPGSGSPSTS